MDARIKKEDSTHGIVCCQGGSGAVAGCDGRRALSEIKKELISEMRKRLILEQNIHFLLVEMLEKITSPE